MRSDIAKKLVERPRFGGSAKKARSLRNQNNDPKNWESSPMKESCKKPNIIGYSGKYLSEYFAPLKRFLAKNVGRPWNSVNSEIREHISPNSTVQKHVLDHLYNGFVVLSPMWIGSIPCGNRGFPLHAGSFYVDPKGFLRRVKADKPRQPPTKPKCVYINDFEEYREVFGSWFWVRYIHLRAGQEGFDVLLKRKFTQGMWAVRELLEAHGYALHAGQPMWSDTSRLCVEKRQLGKREIARLGLNSL